MSQLYSGTPLPQVQTSWIKKGEKSKKKKPIFNHTQLEPRGKNDAEANKNKLDKLNKTTPTIRISDFSEGGASGANPPKKETDLEVSNLKEKQSNLEKELRELKTTFLANVSKVNRQREKDKEDILKAIKASSPPAAVSKPGLPPPT